MTRREPRTLTARLLLRTLADEAANWDDVTTTDAPYIARNRAEGRRDALDWAMAQLRVALPEIEDEAVDIEVRETARLDAVLESVPA